MPLTYFNCPDGVKRPIAQCLENCQRELGRCLSLPTLHELSSGRVWTGKPSTTQLINPTRMEYLKITKNYAITPQERAFALLGTQHHRRLELIAKMIPQLEAEKKLSDAVNTGILDLLEPDDNSAGQWIITDYKTWGSFAVSKINIKGSYERYTASLQLNDYRLKVESLGFSVSKLRWQITVRDGGTYTAKNNGVESKLLVVEADRMDDDEVTEYFYRKNNDLLVALNKSTLPILCPFEERWQGRRCKGELCEVHMFCPEGSQINKVKLES